MSSSSHRHTAELVVVGASGLALGFVLGVAVTRRTKLRGFLGHASNSPSGNTHLGMVVSVYT
jgi:hypothetical protein